MKNYSIRLPDEMMDILREEAKMTDMTVSELIRDIIQSSMRFS